MIFDLGKRVVFWMVCGVTILFGYGLAKLEPFRDARLLPLTWVDQTIPLLPWTVWIYGSGTLVCLLAILTIPDTLRARRLWVALTLSALICWIFFFAWPTTYPRALWPTPIGDSWTLAELADLRDTDSPSNCFPSQHVALAWSLGLCWIEWTQARWRKVTIFVWVGAVCLCTLTTKQHYLIDVPGGMVAGITGWWVARTQVVQRAREVALTIVSDRDRTVLEGLLTRVRAHQWTLDELTFEPAPPLPHAMVALLSQTIWIEQIAGLNFGVLRDASADPVLRELYTHFANEERRHAEGLRRVLVSHGHTLRPPGVGAGMVLDQFDDLGADDASDVLLIATATPVFETFLDAGTLPFLAQHPTLTGPSFDALVERIDRDESAHLAVNWLLTAQTARTHRGWRGLKLLLNPNIGRGMLAVPWLATETYVRAHALGFDFTTLLPSFRKLWRQHRKVPELATSPLWTLFRLFTVCGVICVHVAHTLARFGLLFIEVWVQYTRVTDWFGARLFGSALLEKRGLTPP